MFKHYISRLLNNFENVDVAFQQHNTNHSLKRLSKIYSRSQKNTLSSYIAICFLNWLSFVQKIHDDVIKWKHFLRYWPLCREFTGHRWIPPQRPVTWSFDVFFDLHPNKRLNKQSRGWWFETPSRPLWRNCNDIPWTSWLNNGELLLFCSENRHRYINLKLWMHTLNLNSNTRHLYAWLQCLNSQPGNSNRKPKFR